MLQYQLGSDIKLSSLFGQIEAVRDKCKIEDYSVSQTTLDQVSHIKGNSCQEIKATIVLNFICSKCPFMYENLKKTHTHVQ